MERDVLEKIEFAWRLLLNAKNMDAPYEGNEYVYLCGYYEATIDQATEALSSVLQQEVGKNDLN